MLLSKVGELKAIDYFKRSLVASSNKVLVGIGDDTAVIQWSAKKLLLFTTDMLVENVHFIRQKTTPFQIGWKAMVINMSDIAAMGGIPKFALSAIGLPSNISFDFVEAMVAGMKDAAAQFEVEVVGGDTSASSQIMVNVSMVGEVEKKHLCLRSGAKVGDKIFVTGSLGDSAAGLLCLKENFKLHEELSLIDRHLMPIPKVREAGEIAPLASAMIDISDGLSTEIYHICQASKVGANIYLDQIPISDATHRLAIKLGQVPADLALYGGEDYELLFTASSSAIEPHFIPIGEITPADKEICLVDGQGKKIKLKPRGYEHFL